MNDIIQVKSAKLQRYEELLLKKDSLNKESFLYEVSYIREFGDLIAECFKAKISCIEKKKIIAYCQKAINRGTKPNQADIDRYIEETMKSYYQELKNMLTQNKESKKGERISEYTRKKIKNIYYKIAKLIHPDTNPSLAKDENIKSLWNRTIIAYNCNDLEEIEELEVLVNQYLESINYKGNIIEIPNLDEKIFKLNEEIEDILNTDPYQYKYLLSDVDAIEEKKNEIKSEKEDYIQYGKELDKVIKKFNIERVLA